MRNHQSFSLVSQPRGVSGAAIRRGSVGAVCLALAVLVLPGCGDDKAAQAGGAAQQQQMPAPEVGVIVAKVATVGVVTELPGRVEASRTAQVRARAAGILNKRLFTEGSDVKTGQLLMQIDAAPYQAEVQSAKANLARAEAALVQSKAVVDRYRPLVSVNAVSQLDFDNADATFKAAQAEVAAARAAVRTAEINLGYANVTAPISGRIGRALVTEGALVGQGETTPLAVIQQIDPVYVNFTQSTTEVLKLRRDLQDGRLVRAAGGEAARVSVLLDDGSDYGEPGRLLFTDLTVDPTSSQVTLRAELPNPDGLLLPGMYVRVRLEQAQVANAISVPQQAVTRSQQGDTLTVVDAEGNRQVRSVKLGDAASDNRWVVLEGLQEGEQVMVDGFQRVGMMPPGTKVKAVPWSAPGAPAPSAAAAEAPASGTEASANAKQ